MNRRGSAQDVLLIGALMFMFAIGFLVLNYTTNTVVDKMVTTTAINSSNSTVTALNSVKTNVSNRLDLWAVGILIGLTIALIITGWYIAGNPIFVFIYFIVVIIAVILAMVLSNVWETVSQTSPLVTSTANIPITDHIMLYLPFYIAGIGMLGLVVMFAKPYAGGGGGQL